MLSERLFCSLESYKMPIICPHLTSVLRCADGDSPPPLQNGNDGMVKAKVPRS